jgi:GDP-4-dehydro-6-deoxy-D-mannose reductase
MKILVLGATGFIGKHLVEQLLKSDNEIVATCHNFSDFENNYGFKNNNLSYVFLDLENEETIRNILKDNFDIIFHLAAQSSVADSIKFPYKTFNTNINYTLNLLRLVSEVSKNSKLVFISSSDIYKVFDQEPIKEDNELEVKSTYALSKFTIDSFIRMNAENLGLKYVIIRQFNNIGPGQKDNFVISSFAKQIVEIKLNDSEKKIKVGNIEVFRDFIDVRDSVKAYELAMNCQNEVFNICSSRARQVKELLKTMIEISGLDITIEIDNSRLRKNDLEFVCGDNSKISNLGWKPEIELKETLKDLLDYWENKIIIDRINKSYLE